MKSQSNRINFDSNPDLGLHFTESTVDIEFINNIVIDGRLKILVNQKSGEQFVGMATLWFIVYDENPLSNVFLEDAFVSIKTIGNQLFKITGLGQVFSYKDIYSIPNVSDSWNINDTYITYTENGGFKDIHCLDRNAPIEQDGEDTIFHANGKTVNADLVVLVGSDGIKKQAQFVHVTMPCQKINIQATGPCITGDLSLFESLHGVDKYRSAKGVIYEIYNAAITSGSIFTSYLLLYQIVEIAISEGSATTLSETITKNVLVTVRQSGLLEDVFLSRLNGMLKGLKKETSAELLRSGISHLLGENSITELDYSNFSGWRSFRGKITHPLKTQELTDGEFTVHYKSLRKFVDALAYALP